VLLAGYMLFEYTEFVWDAETRYKVGWMHCGILALNLLINLNFMFREGCYKAKLKLKRRYLRKEAEKKKKAKQL